MKTSSVFALLTGMAAGAVLGLLFAPEAGEESRKKVKKAAKTCLDKVQEQFNDLVSAVGGEAVEENE
jgi:gas vesicle protein